MAGPGAGPHGTRSAAAQGAAPPGVSFARALASFLVYFSWPFFFDPRGWPPYIGGMEQPSVAEIVENFDLMEEWDDRYRYLIELGRALPPLPEAARTDANKVRGCASQVWLSTSVKPNGGDGPVLAFDGDSDAHIVR